MANRRSASRFAVSEHGSARLRLVRDVQVERLGSKEVTIVASGSIPRGEHLLLEIAAGDEPLRFRLVVRAVKRRAVIRDNRLQQRVWLEVVRPVGREDSANAERLAAEWASHTKTAFAAALVREVPIRVIDISRSGCLCESPATVGEGVVGLLEVTLRGSRHAEVARVCRSVLHKERLWPCRSGLEFLSCELSSSTSLRDVVCAMERNQQVLATADESGDLVAAERVG